MAFKFSMTRPAGGAQERRNAYIDQAAQLLQPQGQLVGSQTGVAFQGPSFDQGAQQLQGFVGNYDQNAAQSVNDARWQIQNYPMLQRAAQFGGIPESIWDQAHVAPPQVQIKSMDPTLMQRGIGDPASKLLSLMNQRMAAGDTTEQALSFAKSSLQYDPTVAGQLEIGKAKGREMGKAQALSQADIGKALNDAAYNQQMAKENATTAALGARVNQGLFGKKEQQIQGEKTKGAKDRATEQLQRDIDLADAKNVRQAKLEELRAKLRASNPNAHDNAIQAAMNRAEHQMLPEFSPTAEWTPQKIKDDPSGFNKERERLANEYMKSFGRVKARASNQDLGSSLREALQGYINR